MPRQRALAPDLNSPILTIVAMVSATEASATTVPSTRLSAISKSAELQESAADALLGPAAAVRAFSAHYAA